MRKYKFTYEVVVVEADDEVGVDEQVVTISEEAEVEGDIIDLIAVLEEQTDLVRNIVIEEI